MKDKATVRTINGENVTIVCGAGEGCRSCKANSFCAAKTREVSALNRKGIQLHRGDTVEFFIPPGKTILAGFLVLIFPLLTFILAFLLAGAFLPQSGEGLRALFGLGGLAAGFGISFLYNSRVKHKNLPEILRRLEGEKAEDATG